MYNIKNISETFVFDKYYSTLYDAQLGAGTDDVFPGRYILIKYTNTYYTPEEKQEIRETADETKLNDNQKRWRGLWSIDVTYHYANTKTDCDRLICQKIYEDGKYIYLPLYKDSTEQELTWGEF